MNAVMERYNNVKVVHSNVIGPPTDIKSEAASLRQQVQYMEQCHRQLLGEELSGLSIVDLQNLETQIEKSLKIVRMKKEQTLKQEISELNLKGSLVQQENTQLHNSIELICRENAGLQKKVYEAINLQLRLQLQ